MMNKIDYTRVSQVPDVIVTDVVTVELGGETSSSDSEQGTPWFHSPPKCYVLFGVVVTVFLIFVVIWKCQKGKNLTLEPVPDPVASDTPQVKTHDTVTVTVDPLHPYGSGNPRVAPEDVTDKLPKLSADETDPQVRFMFRQLTRTDGVELDPTQLKMIKDLFVKWYPVVYSERYWNQWFDHHFGPSTFARCIFRERDGKPEELVGLVFARIPKKDPNVFEIASLGVSSTRTRKGVAGFLMKRLEEHVLAHNLPRRLTLSVHLKNWGAIEFYKKNVFQSDEGGKIYTLKHPIATEFYKNMWADHRKRFASKQVENRDLSPDALGQKAEEYWSCTPHCYCSYGYRMWKDLQDPEET